MIGENSIIGYHTTILTHEYLLSEYRVGEVVIGRDVMVGANVTILPGTVIGDGGCDCCWGRLSRWMSRLVVLLMEIH